MTHLKATMNATKDRRKRKRDLRKYKLPHQYKIVCVCALRFERRKPPLIQTPL